MPGNRETRKAYRATSTPAGKPPSNKKQKVEHEKSELQHEETRELGYEDLTLRQASLLGKRVSKYFGNSHNAWFNGTVKGFRFLGQTVWFDIHYYDGDEEELNQKKTEAAVDNFQARFAAASKNDENSWCMSIESDSVGAMMRDRQRERDEEADEVESCQQDSVEGSGKRVIFELDNVLDNVVLSKSDSQTHEKPRRQQRP